MHRSSTKPCQGERTLFPHSTLVKPPCTAQKVNTRLYNVPACREPEEESAVAQECSGVNCWCWGLLTESSSHKSRVMAQSLFSSAYRGSSSVLSLQRSQEQAIQTISHAIYSPVRQCDYSANGGSVTARPAGFLFVASRPFQVQRCGR